MKKLVGQVTEAERDEIQKLFERRNGLTELAKLLTADDLDLYDRLICDLGETTSKFQLWWDRMGEKYMWEKSETGSWVIDFNSQNVYLINNE